MEQQSPELWIDTRLSAEHMNYLHHAIDVSVNEWESEENWVEGTENGNVSRSSLQDKDNWFYETAIKKLTEKMFYRNWNNYNKYVVDQEEPPPEFELIELWVNYQKKHDHVPLHQHGSLYSFVIFMKIPTHWKDQHVIPKFLYISTPESSSDFVLVHTEKNSEICNITHFKLSPEDEGRVLFFPSDLNHQVYPFYGTDEERITVSGNIFMKKPKDEVSITLSDHEKNKMMLKTMEGDLKLFKHSVKALRKQIEHEERVTDGNGE